MNTRLQVEHCVTEMVTVARSRRRAAARRGRRAAVVRRRTSSTRRGHSIECRINAEDPAKGFLPSPGTITRLRVPSGPGRALGRRLRRGRHDLAVLRQPRRQARRVGARPRPRPAGGCCGRCASSRSTASTRPIPAHLALLAHPDFAAGQPLDEVGRGRGRPVAVRDAPARPRRRATAGRRARTPTLVERTVPVEVDGKRFSVQALAARRARRRAPAARRRRRGATAGRRSAAGGGGGDGTDHRADAGHDREGARRRGRRRRSRARRCSCSRR